MKQKTDEAILGLLWQRDESALREIQTSYGKLCHKLANDILRLNTAYGSYIMCPEIHLMSVICFFCFPAYHAHIIRKYHSNHNLIK